MAGAPRPDGTTKEVMTIHSPEIRNHYKGSGHESGPSLARVRGVGYFILHDDRV
jgi:hypothetical protein